MRIDGEWRVYEDGIARPSVNVGLHTADGGWYEVPFVLDTGGDESLLCYETFTRLGHDMVTDPTRHYVGAGGRFDSGKVETKLRLTRDGGQYIVINGPFAANPDPAGADINLLGRDVLNLFAAVIDRPGDVVCLLTGHHTYAVRPA